jgi:hypothetical protein
MELAVPRVRAILQVFRVVQMTVDVDLVDANLEGFLVAVHRLALLVKKSAFVEIGFMDDCFVGRHCRSLSNCSWQFMSTGCEGATLACSSEGARNVDRLKFETGSPRVHPGCPPAWVAKFDRRVA